MTTHLSFLKLISQFLTTFSHLIVDCGLQAIYETKTVKEPMCIFVIDGMRQFQHLPVLLLYGH